MNKRRNFGRGSGRRVSIFTRWPFSAPLRWVSSLGFGLQKHSLEDMVRNDKEFMGGVRRGLEACKAGKVYPLEDVLQELGLENHAAALADDS